MIGFISGVAFGSLAVIAYSFIQLYLAYRKVILELEQVRAMHKVETQQMIDLSNGITQRVTQYRNTLEKVLLAFGQEEEIEQYYWDGHTGIDGRVELILSRIAENTKNSPRLYEILQIYYPQSAISLADWIMVSLKQKEEFDTIFLNPSISSNQELLDSLKEKIQSVIVQWISCAPQIIKLPAVEMGHVEFTH